MSKIGIANLRIANQNNSENCQFVQYRIAYSFIYSTVVKYQHSPENAIIIAVYNP